MVATDNVQNPQLRKRDAMQAGGIWNLADIMQEKIYFMHKLPALLRLAFPLVHDILTYNYFGKLIIRTFKLI